MLGMFNKVASYVWNFGVSSPRKTLIPDLPELEVSDKIKVKSKHITAYEEGNLHSYEEKSGEIRNFNGKVTSLNASERYGLINKEIYFNFNTVLGNKVLSVGDTVSICATRKCKDHCWRAKSVTLLEECWDGDVGDGGLQFVSSSVQQESSTFIRSANPVAETEDEACSEIYSMVAKVSEINNGKGILNNDIAFSLKECKIDFRPIAGDWLSAEVVLSCNQHRVLSLKPQRELNLESKITSLSFGGGIVNSEIVFSNSSCHNGYHPKLGDTVAVRAIESSQGRFEWRAVSVVPVHQPSICHTLPKVASPAAGNFLEQLKCNKEGIKITDPLDFKTLFLGEQKCIRVWISNEGTKRCKLIKCRLQVVDKNCQFSLGSPTLRTSDRKKFSECFSELSMQDNRLEESSCMNGVVLLPGSQANVDILCNARQLGKCCQMVLFDFEGFVIGRHLNVNVQDPIQNSLKPVAPYNKQNKMSKTTRINKGVWVIPGENPQRAKLKFSSNLPRYSVPSYLWDVIDDDDKLLHLAPYLAENLNLSNYKQRFSALMHLEEIRMMLDMKEFDMEEVCLNVRGEHLALKVPGLAEGRPSLLIGDKALLSVPGDDDGHGVTYEGCIHEVFQDSVLLKFNSTFHAKYEGESYNVTFQFNRTPLRKCHQAVSLAVQLGNSVLFPSSLHLRNSLFIEIPPKMNTIKNRMCTRDNLPASMSIPANISNAAIKSNTISDYKSVKEIADLNNHNEIHHLTKASSYMVDKKKKNPTNSQHKIKQQTELVAVPASCEKSLRHEISWFNNQLNKHQKSAVKRILHGQSRPTPYVIFGPPGTGKTVTVVEAVLQVFANISFSRILVCTPSNSAADLVAQRLIQYGNINKADLVRLNSFQRIVENISDSIKPFCTDTNDLQIAAHHRIVITTCVTAGSLYSLNLRTDHFSHVFLDEAGQATEPESMVALILAATAGGQVVLAGDPLQLGPVVRSFQAKEHGLQISFLERLMERPLYCRDENKFADHGNYDPFLVTKLVNNYRSHSAIVDLYSFLFYHSDLICCAPVSQQMALCDWSLLPRSCFPVLFHGIKGEDFREGNSPSWFNPAEVVQVVRYLQDLYEYGLVPSEVGIVTPYRKQVEKINLLISSFSLHSCKVGSVEEFQGQERKAIIISTVRSSEDYVNFDCIHNLGFLSNPKRFNVAISRAQALLIIVGDPHLLCMDPYWNELLNYCCENKAYVGCELPSEHLDRTQEIDPSL